MTELSIAIACAGSAQPLDSGDYCTALCTALACQFAGFKDLTLYSFGSAVPRRPEPQSITLSPNASRILRTLKALEPLTPFCFEPQFIHQRSHRTGFQLSILALGAMAEGRYNAPFLHVSADALCRELEQLAVNRGIRLVDAETPIGVGQSSASVTLELRSQLAPTTGSHKNNSELRAHDVLIVAGDQGNRLRELAGAETLACTDTGGTHWQGSVATRSLPAGAFGPVVTQWLGPEHHLSYHFGADKERLEVSAITGPNGSDLERAFQTWHPSINALLAKTDSLASAPITTTVSPQRLAHGRILFLGSSCHRITPHLPQQVALGIEDAWVAARMLEQWEDEPAGGWVEYEKYRLPRARRMRTQAEQEASRLSLSTPVAIWRRNLALTFGSRFLPELAMQKNDWLYGYDAVNGFE